LYIYEGIRVMNRTNRKSVLDELVSLLWANGYNTEEQSEATLIYQFLSNLIECDDYEAFISGNAEEYNEIMSIMTIRNMPSDIMISFDNIISLYQEEWDFDVEEAFESIVRLFDEIIRYLNSGYGEDHKDMNEIDLTDLLGQLVIEKEYSEVAEQIERVAEDARREQQENKRRNYYAVLEYIQKQKIPVTRADIRKNVPGASSNIVSSVLGSERKILSFYCEYMWVDNLNILDCDLAHIKSILDKIISVSGVHHVQEVYNEMSKYSNFLLHKYMISTPHRLFSICKYFYESEYRFERPYVATKGTKIKTASERIYEYVKDKQEVEIRDILNYAKNNYMQIPNIIDVMAELNGTHLMGTKHKLVKIDSKKINREFSMIIEDIIIHELNESKMKGIVTLVCANQFPDVDIAWNEWLIYSILRRWGKVVKVCTTSSRYSEAIPVVYIGDQPAEEQLEYIALTCKGKNLHMADNMENIDKLIEDIFDDIEF